MGEVYKVAEGQLLVEWLANDLKRFWHILCVKAVETSCRSEVAIILRRLYGAKPLASSVVKLDSSGQHHVVSIGNHSS